MIEVSWTNFKSVVDVRSMKTYIQYIEFPIEYYLRLNDGWLELECRIKKKDIANNQSDQKDFEDNYKTNANTRLTSSEYNAPSVHVIKSTKTSFKLISHMWNDPTTWYQKSTRITGETPTTSDSLTYSCVNDKWINLVSGKIYQEDNFSADYVVKVYADAVLQTTGYTIDYLAGEITFGASKAGVAITVDYSYAGTGSSVFTFAPDAGKILLIEHTEVQCSADTKIPNEVHGDSNTTYLDFDIYAYNPADLPNKVPVRSTRYKSELDIINDSNLGQGWIPHFGNLPGGQNIFVFPFNYGTLKPLRASQGAELRVSLKDDIPLEGSFSSLTIYCMSESE